MTQYTAPAWWKRAPACAVCGNRFEKRPDLGGTRTRDHIIPQSWGGPNAQWNYRPAHRACNGLRRARLGNPEVRDIAENLARLRPDLSEARAREVAAALVDAYDEYRNARTARRRNDPTAIPAIVALAETGDLDAVLTQEHPPTTGP